ncbi:hypothetical protein A9R16_008180 [Acidiferrobacter thiooxydans]|uniref:hypothetical protein n=1 Tax=Acidiferrobacter thiooxydans TaxID=163359 RepID=UPI0008264659|nr:hypothetical protein [Acidiferrobacter thiooxydans]MDA8118665.1 hypothetical protein [Gammaproteobacteria bacterium]UEN98424.1 hypothetical protein A9R16_008180 [Acidiferrobacter thiooxydans]
MIDYPQTLQVVQELLERHDRAGLLTRDPGIVLVGGNALMAHQIRMASGDVDLYFPQYSADIVREVEREGQATYGPDFRLDVTATENLWGMVLIRDIDADSIDVRSGALPTHKNWHLKALSLETLFLVKLDAGREKDLGDLPLIAAKTTAERICRRFGVLVPWHGTPQAIPGYADRLVQKLHTLYGIPESEVVARIRPTLPRFIGAMLEETYGSGPNPGTEGPKSW